jgi:TRAP-type C4-dicarboxylate transport system substrate-binding protein
MVPLTRRTIGALLLCCLSPTALAGAQFHLKLHHALPPAAPAHWSMLVPWSEKVEAASNHRIGITVYPSMHLGGQAPQLMNQVRDGVVDIVWALSGYTPGRFPSLEVFEMPGLTAHPAVMNRALAEFITLHPDEFADYKIVAAFVHAGQALHSKIPIRNANDFAGLKIRIPSRSAGWIVEALGATPIGTQASKIPEMLSKGIVDAAFIPYEVVGSLKVNELVDYHIGLTLPETDRFHTQVFLIAMNRRTYHSLPPDLQRVIDDHSGANIADWLSRIWMDNETPGIALARESGEIIRLSAEQSTALREKMETEVTGRWLQSMADRGLAGPALLAEARALIAKYSARVAGEEGNR